MIKGRPSSGFPLPYVCIEDIFHAFFPLLGQGSSGINIVRSELRIYFRLSIHAVGNDYGHMFASDVTDRFCLPAFRRQVIEIRCFQARNIGMSLPQQNIIHQFTGYRNFSFGCFTQRYADGIAQPVAQQCSDAESRLDTPVLTVSGFCHSEVQWESHPLFFHDVHQQTDGFHHHDRIGRFDGNHYVSEILLDTDAEKFHTGFHHPRRRITIARHDAVGQRTVVHPDTDGRVVLLADIQKRDKPVVNLAYLLSVLLVCIFQFLKSTRSIYIVSRIDTHLFCILGSYIRHFRIEMHIGNQGNHISLTAQPDIDIHQVFGFFDTLGCEADILATCVNNTFRLFHTSRRVLRRRISHRLDTNRIGAAQRHSPNIYFCGFSSKIIE